ncbi:META domain-containing protein [Galbibacter sp.]|jgi:heat shock protein HslJ|uniref:META domain-containing protein n=1 Tax=Galbibacter sp. TaxID=2918471 RepID=UPI003A94D7A5
MKTLGLLFTSISLVLSLSCNGVNNKKGAQNEQTTTSQEQVNSEPENAEASLVDKKWKLSKLMGQPLSELDKSALKVFIIFDGQDKRLSGNSGCNSFGGTYTLKEGNRFETSQMMSTMMACENMDIEDQFMGVLQKADTYIINGNKLQITKARMAPLAEFELEK